MKRMTYFVMALAMVLGFTQCKKEQTPTNNQTEGVFITLNVDGGNNTSRVEVTPGYENPTTHEVYARVRFESGDVIYVGNAGAYCGYLTFNGTNFTGTVNPTSTADYLHFYFMGNKGPVGSAPSTVSITDQTVKYPVISYVHSKDLFDSDVHSYTAKLQNYCSIVKFTTNSIPTDTDITLKGMKNTISVNFGANNAATSTSGSPYTFTKNGDGDITLHAVSNTERWAILLEQDAVDGATVTAFGYFDSTCDVPAIENNTYHSTDYVSVSMTAKIIDLSTVTTNTTVEDGYTVTGTLGDNVMISIADGATVTLKNVAIEGTYSSRYKWAGLTCVGDATIILEGSNTVRGFYGDYPGIQVAQYHTLTIQGSGSLPSLTASSTPSPSTSIGYAAGIGGGWTNGISCGNIVINSGNITAIGANNCAGIGGGRYGSCGNITINGGNVEASGGNQGAGIGGGTYSSCGNITINGGHIIATGGEYAAGIGGGSTSTSSCGTITINGGSGEATKGENAQHSIGAGYQSSCGTVTINGVPGYISDSYYSWSL